MLSPKRLIRYIKAQIKVFRVDRGFTVHSPYAYKFITRVLRERTPYYHFGREVCQPWEKLLYRVAVHFNPARICCLGEEAARARQVLSLALPSAEFCAYTDKPDFTFCSKTDSPVPCEAPVLFTHLQPHDEEKYTLTFTDGHTAISLRRKGIPRQRYIVHFRS